ITIELGFAPLKLDGVGTIGVVDVPGHEGFVRTMLAGATGVDLALLVIAADESVMPQTREHFAILRLLGVTRGVVALTKCDLVDDEWRALVVEDVRALLADSPLADAAVVGTSSVTGAGLAELRTAIADAARAVPARAADDLFRMPVDRAFTIKGTGTVVTGTVWSGRLTRDGTVRVMPGDRTVRVRGLETHGDQVQVAEPVVLRAGDRFVLRSTSPAATVGGGIVIDPFATRRARPWSTSAHAPAAERLSLALNEAGEAGVEIATLPVRLGVLPRELAGLLAPKEVLQLNGRVYAVDVSASLEQRLV